MKDILGQALIDYFEDGITEHLITETNISEEDELPLSYFFRSFSEMPELEQKALQLCRGKVLDIGCGAGCHSLWLQDKGLEVTAIDMSEGAIQVAGARGIKQAECLSILDFNGPKFDTLLLLMNGTGIFETIEQTSAYLQHLKGLLQPGGQILIDSSDLQYMYDSSEEGGIWVPADRYYGELEFTITYGSHKSDPFPWLYLDERLFEELAEENGLAFEILARGNNFDYLARLT